MKVLIYFYLTLLVLSVVLVVSITQVPAATPSHAYPILLFLFITTSALFYYLLRSKINHPGTFVQFYLLTIAVKLIAYAGFLIFVILKNKDGAAANVVFFMIVYFLFTMTEVAFLYRRVSR
jgi:hypothetical protein